MILIIDNTKKQKTKMYLPHLVKYFRDKNIPYTLIDGGIHGLFALKTWLASNTVSGIVLSGSPIMPYTHLDINDYITNLHCLEYTRHIPILGICFGCQLINVYYGGSLHDMKDVVCKKMKVFAENSTSSPFLMSELSNTTPWSKLEGIAQFCCRYLPERVGSELDVKMRTKTSRRSSETNEFPCVLQHKHRPILGVMFHPEAMKKTHAVLDHFMNITRS